MDFDVVRVDSHFEVRDRYNRFVSSADSFCEAMEDICDLKGND